MAGVEVLPPFQVFTDVDGTPLEAGFIFIGQVDQNPEVVPVNVFWDAALTVPAAQPIRTIGGYPSRNGTPSKLFVSVTTYSIIVKDRKQDFVYSALNSQTLTELDAKLTDATTVSNGAAMIGRGVQIVKTIAELRGLLKTSVSKAAFVQGYYASGDGGGGPYYLDAADTTSVDNGGTVIVATDGGRWKLIYVDAVDANQFGAIGNGTISNADMLTRLTAAWNWALANGEDLHFSKGTYQIGENNFPWRQETVTTLLDCKNITLICDGPATIFKTASVGGADVFQLNGLKNFHVRGFPTLTATVSGSASGSNGVSITNGYDNITLEVTCLNLQSLDKGTFIDGGKALTLQNGATSNECGTLDATVYANGCSEGFGFEPVIPQSVGKKTSVTVKLIAENCYTAVKGVAAAATGALANGVTTGVRVTGQAINCQKDAVLQRMHGISVDLELVTTKDEAARRLSPFGIAWFAADAVVEALHANYVKSGQIRLVGYKGACAFKAQIGGASPGSSGLNGSSEFCDIYLDIGGTATTQNIIEIDSGGNTLKNSVLRTTSATTTTIPAAFQLLTNKNVMTIDGVFTSSFTGTLTGCTTTPTGTIKFSVTGDLVTLEIPTIEGTSNTTAATITGMPADIFPTTQQGTLGITKDNGVNAISRINIATNGIIDLFYGATTGVFTAAGTKGIQFMTVTYRRS